MRRTDTVNVQNLLPCNSSIELNSLNSILFVARLAEWLCVQTAYPLPSGAVHSQRDYLCSPEPRGVWTEEGAGHHAETVGRSTAAYLHTAWVRQGI